MFGVANHRSIAWAIAARLNEAGAAVTMVSGPVSLQVPDTVRRIGLNSADEMLRAVRDTLEETDSFIAAAAVSDYRVAQPVAQKLKKKNEI